MNKNAIKRRRSSEVPVETKQIAVQAEPTELKVGKAKMTEAASGAASTAEPVILIDSDVTRRIRQHARSHLKTEVCGVLIGESNDGMIEIRASIEALNAAQAGTHVTFTQDAWEEIYKVKDDLYPDERIVGWYHSHPGFGIFLSEHDLFIQENFFSSPGQVAWVYDPHSDDEGCFGWVAGKVARLTSISTLYQSGDPVEHATKGRNSDADVDAEDDEDAGSGHSSSHVSTGPLWVVVLRSVLTHLTLLIAGFAIAFFFFPRLLAIVQDPASGSVLVFDYHEVRSYLDGTGSAPKPLDSFGALSPVAHHNLPVTPSLPAAVPSNTSKPAPAPVPPPASAATPPTEPAHPQSEKPGSHK